MKSKKLFVVLRNLVIAEVLVYLAFMALALSADWGKIYEGFVLARYIRFEVIEFSLLGLSQLGLIVLVFARSLNEETDVNEMLKAGEHEKLEFKTSLRWDIKQNQVNRELEKTVMKTVTAFLNSDGGHLLMGVDDKGKPIGLENDFASLVRQDADGFENHFNNLFKSMVGPEFRRLVKLTFNNIENKTICLINVEPGHKPAYLKTGAGEDFYIRTGNVTTPLKMSEVAAYTSSWWRQK
ncbi:MAG: ATP-binding protein [Candidatus Yanofskybacteria bacterium]|nr:ATP-binding protein [Candidatus Yanofskybacteria bacterium]